MANAATTKSTDETAKTGAVPRRPTGSGTVAPERNGQHRDNPKAVALLRQVCARFGVNPDPLARPEELLSWTYYGGDPENDIPAAVTIVTAGGRKLKLFADDTVDDDTVQMLGRTFGLKPHPDGSPWTAAELPEDLTLPSNHVTGYSPDQQHRYEKGYLREGGKVEAARRQALKKPAGGQA